MLRAASIRVSGREKGGRAELPDLLVFLRPVHPVPKWFGGMNKRAVTLRAWSLACSSSKACCFSFSSILLKDMPVEDRELTALDRVDALQRARHMPPVSYRPLENPRKSWDNSGAYLVSAFSSLVFLPSKDARCCSKASRRLLGAWNRQDN